MDWRGATSDDARQVQMMRVHTVHNVVALTCIRRVLRPEWCIPSPTARAAPRAAATRDGKRYLRLFIYKGALRSIPPCKRNGCCGVLGALGARNDLPWNVLAFKDWDHMVRIDIVAVER